MIDKIAIDLSNYRMEKAKDLFLQAELLFNNKKYDGSINRSYYTILGSDKQVVINFLINKYQVCHCEVRSTEAIY